MCGEYWVVFGQLAIKTTFMSLLWRTRQKGCFSFWLGMFSWYCNKRLTIWPMGSLFDENASSYNCNSFLDALKTLEEKPIKPQIAFIIYLYGEEKVKQVALREVPCHSYLSDIRLRIRVKERNIIYEVSKHWTSPLSLPICLNYIITWYQFPIFP